MAYTISKTKKPTVTFILIFRIQALPMQSTANLVQFSNFLTIMICILKSAFFSQCDISTVASISNFWIPAVSLETFPYYFNTCDRVILCMFKITSSLPHTPSVTFKFIYMSEFHFYPNAQRNIHRTNFQNHLLSTTDANNDVHIKFLDFSYTI